jgi:hypothetical protein
MTTYAYDTSTNNLVAVWENGIGATARTVARLHARTGVTVAMNLAEALTRMSKSVWLSYTEPELVDLPVAAVRRALRRPNLPQDDLLRVDEHPVVESAHRVGRELREVSSAGVSRAVIADVEQEMAAAEDAGRGDLTGRAQQAVMLTRVMPSPAQIAVADRLLHEVPMGSPRLFTEVEPSAAGVAAIHWFLAALAVVARHADLSEADALEEAGGVQYFDPAAPRAVLGNATSDDPDRTPLTIGRNLLQAAVLQARGMVLTPHDPEPDEPYFTVLDPSRPARCLLDGLVGAIQALGALYAAYVDGGEWTEAARERFDAAVREEAAARTPERMSELVGARS